MMRFALLGHPLSHSFSPKIHNLIYKLYNVDATYELKDVAQDDLSQAIIDLKMGKYQGFNVTIPYKIEIMKYLDDISDEARLIGSVNTVAIIEGKAIGFNTDYYGFIDELNANKLDVNNKDIYVLGTGGASKAVVKALSDLGAHVSIVSRTKTDETVSYEEINNITKIDGIVNTTPVGMWPNTSNSPLNEAVTSRAGFVLDIIFNPLKTKLMSFNKNSYNGLEMLVYQACKAFNIWFSDINIDKKEIYERIRGELYE